MLKEFALEMEKKNKKKQKRPVGEKRQNSRARKIVCVNLFSPNLIKQKYLLLAHAMLKESALEMKKKEKKLKLPAAGARDVEGVRS